MLTAGPNDPIVERIRRELRSLGYVDGQTIRIEYREAQGQVNRLPQLAQERADQVDAIIVGAESIARAGETSHDHNPTVMVASTTTRWRRAGRQPERPNGNVTGIFHALRSGRQESALPASCARRVDVAVLYDAFDPAARGAQACRSHAWHAAPASRSSPPYDYNAAFKDATKKKADAVMVLSSPHSYVARDRIAKLALQRKLPTIGQGDALVRAGGLIS
jgi:putative ABC transport system substrate-binding protein